LPKAGLAEGGREMARANLDWLWGQVGAVEDNTIGDWMIGLTPRTVSRALEYSLPFAMADTITRVVSPYASGPFYSNPLRRIVDRFRFDAVCGEGGPSLFISATNVRTGKIRVFSGDEITSDVILASACLPTLFRAVELADPDTGEVESYWDGGYSGNPALFPLFDPALPDDIVVVNINPIYRAEVPRSAPDILNRINEISFNAALLRELRAIGFVRRLIRDGKLEKGAMKDVLVHMIADDALMNELSVATKLLPTPFVLARLKEAGRRAAESFLTEHRHKIGEVASLDIEDVYA
jgi:NTE family protein